MAPRAAASSTAYVPTPPVAPTISTTWPSAASIASTQWIAVMAASPMHDARSKSRFPGLCTTKPSRGTATDSAYAPRHRWGSVGTMPVTSSPTTNPVAPSPSASISPA